MIELFAKSTFNKATSTFTLHAITPLASLQADHITVTLDYPANKSVNKAGCLGRKLKGVIDVKFETGFVKS